MENKAVSPMRDEELVDQYIAGNQSCFETLISRHKNKVYTYIVLLVKDHALAEDIFQETFIKVLKSLSHGKYQEKGIFVSWVMRIAHNLVIDHFRKSKHLPTVTTDSKDINILNSKKFSDTNIEEDLIQEQICTDVRKLVDQLPPDQKEVILLRHFGGLSFKEIADLTNVSINTALGRMRYALINMRKLAQEKKMILSSI